MKIVSGGQSGADRAALDWAIAQGVPHGGWCPRGRRAEDGSIAAHYALQETSAESYGQRTEWNVRDSDGTVIFTLAPGLTGGSKETREFACAQGKPCLQLSKQVDGSEAATRLRTFLREHGIRVLNVAGPRASEEPALAGFVAGALTGALIGDAPC